MRPDYMSYDEYGTVALAHLLMYVNSVFCIEEFDLSTVILPSMESIIDICKDKYPNVNINVSSLKGVNL